MHRNHACDQRTHSFGIVMDAGSTGTRLRVFCWPSIATAAHILTFPKIRDAYQTDDVDPDDLPLRRRPGLSAFAHDPSAVTDQVLSLVDEARQFVPAEAAATAPLYVRATAGLRLLTTRQAETVLEVVSRALSNRTLCPFSFAGARVISGEEEALFGWLAINHLLGRFDRLPWDPVGWLDLGGASAQIAHWLPEGGGGGGAAVENGAAHMVTLPDGRSMRVSLRSHMRAGREEAFRRSCRLLARRSAAARERLRHPLSPSQPPLQLDHPCMFAGDELSFRWDANQNGNGNGNGAPPAVVDILFVGSGDAAGCEETIGDLVSAAAHADDGGCTPDVKERCKSVAAAAAGGVGGGDFFGAGNYYYTARQLSLASSAGVFRLSADDFGGAARATCRVPWVEARAQANASSLETRHSRFGCFSGLYVSALLQHEHGMPHAARQLAIARTLHSSLVDWSLGALLHELVLAPSDRRRAPPTTGAAVAAAQHACCAWVPSQFCAVVQTGVAPLWCVLMPACWVFGVCLLAWLLGCAYVRRRASASGPRYRESEI